MLVDGKFWSLATRVAVTRDCRRQLSGRVVADRQHRRRKPLSDL